MSDYSVELESPDGRKVVSTSPAETVELVYGHGYRDVSGKRPDEVTDVNYAAPRSSTKAKASKTDEGSS